MNPVEEYKSRVKEAWENSQLLAAFGIPLIFGISYLVFYYLQYDSSDSYMNDLRATIRSQNPYSALADPVDVESIWWRMGMSFMVMYVLFIVTIREYQIQPKINVIWFRKFNTLEKGIFPYYRLMKSLQTFGMRCITLQDGQVRRSLGKIFSISRPGYRIIASILVVLSIIAIIIITIEFFAYYNDIDEMGMPWSPFESGARLYGILLIATVSPYAMQFVAWLVFAAYYGVRGYDQIKDKGSLEKHSRKVFSARNRPPDVGSGVMILQTEESIWQDTVRAMLKNVDAAVVDVTDLGKWVLWELKTAVDHLGVRSVVVLYAYKDENQKLLPEETREHILKTVGEDIINELQFVAYPEFSGGGRRKLKATMDGLKGALENSVIAADHRDLPAARTSSAGGGAAP